MQLVSSSTGAEPHERKSKRSQTRGSQSLIIFLPPTLPELCCQHFNGALPGTGPVSDGELVVSERQIHQFQVTSHHLGFRNAKLRLGKATALQSTSDEWQLSCTVPSSSGAKVIPTSSPGQLGSRRAGPAAGDQRPEEAVTCPKRLSKQQ